jgi:hypothetical protein
MVSKQLLASSFSCAMAWAIALCPLAAHADEAAVVVLRSGGVLHGSVAVSGERYVVTRANSVVDVPAPQVLLVARSMDDAYRRQRQQLPRDTNEARLALAAWCLRYDLLDAARQELADARQIDPRDPRMALLERRLAVASQSKTAPAATAQIKPHDDSSKAELRKLELLVDDLPPETVERFARKVQPLLVNNCTASGCHQAGGKQEFQLDRAVVHGLSNRRLTLRNLVATLELIDRDAPAESDLLRVPRRVHGGMDRPVFSSRQEGRIAQLSDWVALVTESDLPNQRIASRSKKEAAQVPVSDPFGLGDVAPSKFLDPDVVPASNVLPGSNIVPGSSIAPANFDDPTKSLRPKAELKFGLDLRPWQPKDEFDPEIFNRDSKKRAGTATMKTDDLPATR